MQMKKQSGKAFGADTLFRTPVEVSTPLRKLRVEDRSVFLGSCFAENVGGVFSEAGLQALVCPLGPVYCPAALVRLLTKGEALEAVQGPSGWHTWLSDTKYTRPTRDEALSEAQRALDKLHTALDEADHLFLTFGTSHTYRLLSSGEVVVNCHKHPGAEFTEQEQSVEEMTEALDAVLCSLKASNPKLLVTLTVSPYRYAKYGFHRSQLSKAALLLTADALERRHPEWVQYFPAYEIVMDELRDYRFYADDMLHPSPRAICYIWQRLHEWMDEDLIEHLQQWEREARALAHRPINPNAPL